MRRRMTSYPRTGSIRDRSQSCVAMSRTCGQAVTLRCSIVGHASLPFDYVSRSILSPASLEAVICHGMPIFQVTLHMLHSCECSGTRWITTLYASFGGHLMDHDGRPMA